MGGYNPAYSDKLRRIMAVGINMVCNPMVNLDLQGRPDGYPKRVGSPQVKELLGAGVNVAFGHDDVMDPWYPRHRQPASGGSRRHARGPAPLAGRDRGVASDGHRPGRGRARPGRRVRRGSGRPASFLLLPAERASTGPPPGAAALMLFGDGRPGRHHSAGGDRP